MDNKNPFHLISSEKKYENPWISVREDAVIRPGGKNGIFGIVTMKDGVTIIALDDDDNIYLTKEYAYAVGYESIEAISGGIEEGEDILTCAKRETAEETGLSAESWEYLGYIDPFTNVIKSRNHIYLARKLHRGTAHPDEGEMISSFKVPFSEALQMVYDSRITHAASVMGILRTKDFLSK